MADLDNILSNIDLEEQKMETEEKDWYCKDCEHGPMFLRFRGFNIGEKI